MKYSLKLISLSLLFYLLSVRLPAQSINLEEGLIAHYTFDGNAKDARGVNNGDVFEARPDSGICGGQSYYFDGISSYIDCGNDRSLNEESEGLSISVWINFKDTVTLSLSTVIAKWAFDPRNDQFGIWLDANKHVLFAVNGRGTMEPGTFSKQSLSPDTWYNITATWNISREIKIYINGRLDQTGFQLGSGINQGSTVSLKIGREITGRDRPYKGDIDEIRIYNRTLNIREAEYIYEEGFPQCGNIYIRGQVLNQETGFPVHATVDFDDMTTGNNITSVETQGEACSYVATIPGNSTFNFYAKADCFFSVDENVSTFKMPVNRVILKNLFLVPVETGASISMNNIFFDVNKSILKKESYTALERFVPLFDRFPNLKIEIAGHTDSTGSATENQRLSEARANAVRDYFLSRGVNAERIVAKGYGDSQPVAPNDTEEGRAKNRRVEFRVLGK